MIRQPQPAEPAKPIGTRAPAEGDRGATAAVPLGKLFRSSNRVFDQRRPPPRHLEGFGKHDADPITPTR